MRKFVKRSHVGIFTMNASDQHHWTLNSCSSVFRNIWVHLGPFGYCMKPSAKQAELVQLMQKIVQQSRVGIFPTETPDPHHWTTNSCFGAFRNVSVHLGPFHYCMKLGVKRAELVQLMQNFMQRRCVRIFCKKAPDPYHWTLNSCFNVFHNFRVHFGPFRYCTKPSAKQAEQAQ